MFGDRQISRTFRSRLCRGIFTGSGLLMLRAQALVAMRRCRSGMGTYNLPVCYRSTPGRAAQPQRIGLRAARGAASHTTRGEIPMICSRRMFSSTALAAAAAFVAGGPVLAATRRGRAESFAAIDSDHDGTIDQAEADNAASAMFDRLDSDHDGTLSRQELGHRVSAAEFAAADTDKDGALTKDEYLALVKRRFGAADSDRDGTLTSAEFRTRAGAQLRSLLS